MMFDDEIRAWLEDEYDRLRELLREIREAAARPDANVVTLEAIKRRIDAELATEERSR